MKSLSEVVFEDLEGVTAERDELKAQVVAIGEALEACHGYVPGQMMTSDLGKCVKCGYATASGTLKHCPKCALKLADDAISSSAGKELMERVRKLEAVAKAARECDAECPAGKPWWVHRHGHDKLRQALTALEGGPSE